MKKTDLIGKVDKGCYEIKPLFNFGPSREGGGLVDRGLLREGAYSQNQVCMCVCMYVNFCQIKTVKEKKKFIKISNKNIFGSF